MSEEPADTHPPYQAAQADKHKPSTMLSPSTAYNSNGKDQASSLSERRGLNHTIDLNGTDETSAKIQASPISPVHISRAAHGMILPVASTAQIETMSDHSRTPSVEQKMDIPELSHLRLTSPPAGSQAAIPEPTAQPLPPALKDAANLSDNQHIPMDLPSPPPQAYVKQNERSQPTSDVSHNDQTFIYQLPHTMMSMPEHPPPLPPTYRKGSGSAGPGSPAPASPMIKTTDEAGLEYLPDQDGEYLPPQMQEPPVQPLSYFHNRSTSSDSSKPGSPGSPGRSHSIDSGLLLAGSRPGSQYLLRSDSPGQGSPDRHSTPRRTPLGRPMSYIDLLNTPYPQPGPSASTLRNEALRPAVGLSASLLSQHETFEMYKANVKKTNDPSVQYDFAIFMVNAAREAQARQEQEPTPQPILQDRPNRLSKSPSRAMLTSSPLDSPEHLLTEARDILAKLSERSYPFAQYYLADGYASGVFSRKGEPDNDRAFALFVAASKHGHAEAAYRAGLCYEFGWGTRRDGLRASNYYRTSATKSHPGAMARLSRACIFGDLGMPKNAREGVRWLKRAAETADAQYNAAPYDLGALHEQGWDEGDVFKDEAYAAQLFTQAAGLGNADGGFKMGEAYELGKLGCPRDPALSVHFYTGSAEAGDPRSMMGLCAWYLVGAGDLLERDEVEAFEWAHRAGELGLPKAAYATGYFTEMGIGCRRDPLEANVWYVRAADLGDDRAKLRLASIHAAAGASADGTLHLHQNQSRVSLGGKRDSNRKSPNGSRLDVAGKGDNERRKSKSPLGRAWVPDEMDGEAGHGEKTNGNTREHMKSNKEKEGGKKKFGIF